MMIMISEYTINKIKGKHLLKKNLILATKNYISAWCNVKVTIAADCTRVEKRRGSCTREVLSWFYKNVFFSIIKKYIFVFTTYTYSILKRLAQYDIPATLYNDINRLALSSTLGDQRGYFRRFTNDFISRT